jgi:Tol biopolymer transport system component
MLFDLRSVAAIGDLEEFGAFRNGTRFKEADFNYWGVTFSARDSNIFYATLRTGTTNFLVRGDVAKRRVDVVAEDVECPSLSPDERRIAFKRRENQQLSSWRLHVIDLATRQTSRIEAATNYVDDQVEWLDDEHVLFALPHMGTADIWVAPIAGAGRAQIFVHDGESPIVVRNHDGAARESAASSR